VNKITLLLVCWFSAVCGLAQSPLVPVIKVGDAMESIQVGEPDVTWVKSDNAWFPDWREMPNMSGDKEAGGPRTYLEGPPFLLWNDSFYDSLAKLKLPDLNQSQRVLTTRFIIDNATNKESAIMIRLPMGWQANLYYYPFGDTLLSDGLSSGIQYAFNGKWVPVKERPIAYYQAIHKLVIGPHQSFQVLAEIRPLYSLYQSASPFIVIKAEETFQKENTQRHLWQGIFFGVILVMALYNLFLFFAVKDNSYLHYVLSIIGVGLYFAFYYGFGIEYLWPNAPRWDTWCYTLIVPFTSLARLWFTRTYLHTPTTLPGLNRLMNVLNFLMSATLFIGLITYLTNTDWLAPLVTTIGILNTFILMIMLVAGIMAYRKNYSPARYFIYANAPLVVGAIAFILREMGYLPDSWFTRYSVQVGVVIQVVLFALGLASRLNQTRSELAAQRIEKERLALEAEKERKALIEQQKTELEETVKMQTQSLREQNEKLTQLNAVKDKLFSVLTHDLRNPLATMQSFLKLLTEQYDKLTEEEKEKLFKEAQESLDHLNRLLFHLLQWSKSQMNLLDFNPQPVNLAEAAERNRRVLHLQARLKQISIETDIPDNAVVLADANMLDFILRNLLGNAIKFSHKGGAIKISAAQKDNQWQIHISDAGVGMHHELVQQIKTTYISTARRGTDKERGTGLGLLISREFIEKNNGTLEIESEHGKGTTVIFSLPKLSLSTTSHSNNN
jgi:two-component system, sensor histidine kinase LadS